MSKAILLFGGASEERLVSVASAQNASSQFAREDRALWFIAPDGSVAECGIDELRAHSRPFQDPFHPKAAPFARSMRDAIARADGRVFFLALHGTEGEDGSLQALLEGAGLAFTGSDARSSRLCFDKAAAKAEAAKAGLRVAAQILLEPKTAAEARAKLAPLLEQHKRIVLKPLANGSSVGLRIVGDAEGLAEAAQMAASSADRRFMAEPFVSGREITVGVVDFSGEPEALPVSEVILEQGRSFDYEGKYLGRGTREITPADLPPDEVRACQEAALKAHRALQCYGYSRTDFILDASGPTFLETNTLPGLSRSSFIPQQLAAHGRSLGEFVERQIELARGRAR